MRLTPAQIADAAAYVARTYRPVDEVWLIAPDLFKACGDRYCAGVSDQTMARAFTLPMGYTILAAVDDFPGAAMIVGDPRGDDGYPFLYAPLAFGRGDWYWLDDSSWANRVIGHYPDNGEPITNNDFNEAFATEALYTRFWAVTDKIARRHGYCEQSDQRARSTSHREIPLVSVVRWRKIAHTDSDGTRDIEWSHRWIVRAHLRHLNDGRVIPVREHVKGPEGLPLVVKASVNVLSR